MLFSLEKLGIYTKQFIIAAVYYMYVQFITNLNQFLLDWGLGQVVFATD
jgi:hypothetical protein